MQNMKMRLFAIVQISFVEVAADVAQNHLKYTKYFLLPAVERMFGNVIQPRGTHPNI